MMIVMCALPRDVKWHFFGVWQLFWSDSLPDTTSDSRVINTSYITFSLSLVLHC